ncbi:MAG: hypothetical protein IJ192_13420 [Clostridia bacterium]|nr:hypothetical protein [Clostridia bacterium]MBR2176722.1 hypothetical protein [Clostridia bacterium]
MGFQDDWMMRQIEMLTRFVANVVFSKKESEVKYEIVGNVNDSDSLKKTDELHLALCHMIQESRIGEAEDMLFDNMEYSDKYIELASDFYSRLNSLSDAELETADFSREEIYDGYIEIMSLLGVPIDVFGQGDRSEY